MGIRIFRLRLGLPVLISGAAFGLGHLCLLPFFPPLFLAQIVASCTLTGLIAGYFRERTGSLLPAVAAHVAANAAGWAIPALVMGLGGGGE